MNRRNRSGFTLTEVMMAVFVFLIAVTMVPATMKLVNYHYMNLDRMQTQRDVENTLFQITKDVRNARSIIEIDSTPVQKMVLSSYDLQLPSDIDASTEPEKSILSAVNLGTTTYQFVQSATETYLLRRTEFRGAIRDERKLLTNMLNPDDPTLAGSKPIFQTDAGQLEVEITLRIAHGMDREHPQLYQASAMPRSQVKT